MAKVSTADAISQPRLLGIEPATICIAVLFSIVAFLVLTPLLLLVVGSFQLARPGEAPVYGLAGWRRAFSDPSILQALWNTVSLSVVRQSIALVIGVLLSWLIARTDLPWKKGLEFMFWISFFLPPLPVALGWILLLDGKFGLLNQWLHNLSIVSGPIFNIYSYWGIVWVHMTTSLGVKVLLLAPAFRNLDASLEESARSCGANPAVTLIRIVIPLMMPAILVSTVLGLIRSMEAFEIELLLGVPINLFVYSTKIRDLVAYEPPEYAPATALGSIFLLVLLIMVVLQRRYLGQRLYRTVSGRGFSTNPTSLGRWRWPIFSAVALIAFTVTVVPLVVLLMGTFMRAFGYFNIPRPWTIENWQRVLADPSLIKSLWNTLIVGLGTAVSGAAFYALIAYVVVRRQFKGKAILDFISWLPWAIPGILMGLALLWTVFETQDSLASVRLGLPADHRSVHQEHAFRRSDRQERASPTWTRARRSRAHIRRFLAAMLPPRADPALDADVHRRWPARLYLGGARYQYHRIVGFQPIAHDGAAGARLCLRRAIRARRRGRLSDIARCHRHRFDRSRRRQQGRHRRSPLECLDLPDLL